MPSGFAEGWRADLLPPFRGLADPLTADQLVDISAAAPLQTFTKADLTTASLPDNVGQKFAAPAPQDAAEINAVALVLDDIADDSSTSASLTVDGPRLFSTINTPGDQDWVRVELEAGVTYEIGMYASRQGASGVPLFDPLVEIYDSAGNRLRFDDSSGPVNPYQTDDALLTFKPEVSGTYYVNARAWDARDPVGVYGGDPNPATTTGDFVGDYELFVRLSHKDPDFYPVRYETQDDPATERDEIGMPTLDSSPLHAIDWRTEFDGTSRNPDGAEGPRVTGNAVETKEGGKNVLTYYFAREGELFVDNAANPLNLTTTMVAKGFSEWEKNAIELGLERYENVADLVYVETDDRFAADIVFVTYPGTPGIATPSLAGRMSPPDTASEGQTEYNAGDYRWTPEGLAPGGVFFGTLIHELGHGHGMAHPHDTGGGSSVMRGVEEVETFVYTLGDFGLNQGVYTMMSYQDGWQESPYGQPDNDLGYGFIGSLMAFDIAVIQDKYGVNEEFATGNDVYVLPDENSAAQFDADGVMTKEGTSWKSIWDAGGLDSIVYNGSKDANIDLRPATLQYEQGGGGWVSYAYGVHGGFTVANSVTIENAAGGSGNDTLIGNDVRNVLSGGAGNDRLDGGGGGDRLEGGLGNDTFIVDNSRDVVVEASRAGTDTVEAGVGYTLSDNVENLVYTGTAGASLNGNAQNNLIDASGATGAIVAGGGGGRDTIIGGAGADRLSGGDGNDTLSGRAGNDILNGGGGIDVLEGGAGADIYAFDQASLDGSIDRISGFKSAEGDRINLRGVDANTALTGDQAFKFVGSAAFSGSAGELHLVQKSGKWFAEGDVDGDKVADLMIDLGAQSAPLVQSDFLL